MISLDNFAKFRFCLSDVPVLGDVQRVLTISNVSSELILVHSLVSEKPVYLTSGDEEVGIGAPLSIAYEARYTKPDYLDKKLFDKVTLAAGEIISAIPLVSDPESFFLTVDFGPIGVERITLVDTDSSKILVGRLVVALTNLAKECIHDQTAVLICFKNAAKRNIPFLMTDPVEKGARFTI